MAKTFALSKLYYVAQVLPLPDKHKRKVESLLSKFIFRGRHEKMKLSELENSCEKGGLGLPNLSVKANSLLMKQLCRMLTLPNEESYRMLGYWLGSFLKDTGLGGDFPQLSEAGPVSHTMPRNYPLHKHMLDTFLESVGRGEIRPSNVTVVTTKEIYKSRMVSLLLTPKVEAKFPSVNFPHLVYPRVNHPVLETRQKDILFTMVHGLYKNRDRLFQQNRTDDPLCPNQACKNLGMVQTVEHIATTCYRVKSSWLWVKAKLLELLSDQGPVPALGNMELIMLTFPRGRKEAEAVFLLGTYL